MKLFVEDQLNESGEKVTRLVVEAEALIEVELFKQLAQIPGYLEHLRRLIDSVLDEVSDPPNGPEDF